VLTPNRVCGIIGYIDNHTICFLCVTGKGIKSMNMIEYYKEKGLSIEGQHQIDVIRGCILASHLDTQDKREMLDFMTALEEYLEDEED